jgi:hypothetical protein
LTRLAGDEFVIDGYLRPLNPHDLVQLDAAAGCAASCSHILSSMAPPVLREVLSHGRAFFPGGGRGLGP